MEEFSDSVLCAGIRCLRLQLPLQSGSGDFSQ
jgi:hypothetical protein